MRLTFRIITILLILLFSGCSNSDGKKLVFFYDKEFGQVAELAPAVLSEEDKPVFKNLADIALESGYALKPVSLDIIEKDYLSFLQSKLPQHDKQIVITSFLYTVPAIQELLDDYQVAVVGASIDIPVNKLKVIGNGFNLIEDEGKMLAAAGKNNILIALKSDFQKRIADAFLGGSGSMTGTVIEAELNASMLKALDLVKLNQTGSMVVASYGPCFKSFSSPQNQTGSIRVLNYPAKPEYADPYLKKKVEAFICYDFTSSFKSAILELASESGEKKSFYSFDLIRR